ncbi:MAG: exosortase/archaeosortase family protein [Puniceicoccaceae bacterium]|nr:MAG: exosortase/archaeosortase family protein [Puniceicoccaceae bacterium]
MPIRQELAASIRKKYGDLDFWLHCLLFLLLGAALWPLTAWFAQTAHDQSRIFHALIVLSVATVLLVRFGQITLTDTLELNRSARRALFTAYGLLALSYLGRMLEGFDWLSLLIVPAYCWALAAGVRFVFGEGTRRLTRTVAITLCVFLFISIWMAPLDWPLRSIAGVWSEAILSGIGQETGLGLYTPQGEAPMLILVVNQHPFHVAAECNGFGVILTSLLLAILLAVHRRSSLFRLILNITLSLALGLAFNILRIVIIVLLAPSLMDHYDLMHEIVGGITYWACLILVWLVCQGPTQFSNEAKSVPQAEAEH